MSDDYAKDTTTTGTVAVGGTATGDIETGNDFDWFAVQLVAGRTYVIDLEGADSGGGTLDSTVLRGIHDSQGTRIAGTQTNDGGDGDDARLVFTATESGTYYIAARGYRNETGTYTVRVTEGISDDTRAGAHDLGDITGYDRPRFPSFSLDGDGDRVDYFKFTLTEAKQVGLGLRRQDADADLILEDGEGNELFNSTQGGTANEWISATLLAGTYYVRVEAQEAGENAFKLRYGVSAPDADRVAELEAAQEEAINEAPAFAEAGYAFGLAENADGSATRVALGTVAATDPEGDPLSYSVVGGNGDGLFEIDATTGALSYRGTGEDYESDTTSHVLTVRASDGALHSDVSVTVNVTDVVEPELSVSDAEAEEADGVLRFRVTLSAETTAPVSVNYATAGGTATAGEDYTSDSGTLVFLPGETEKLVEVTLIDDGEEDSGETLTLELSGAIGGSLSVASATGTILDSETADPSTPASVSEPEDADLPADTSTTGRVTVGGSVTGAIGSDGDRDWFAVALEAGRTYRIDLKGADSGAATLSIPTLRGMYDADGNPIKGTTDYDGGVGRDSRLVFTPTADGTYYIAAAAFGSRQGTYELAVTDLSADGDRRADATDLGDITELEKPEFLGASLGGADRIDYFRFALREAREVELGLRRQDANADLFLEDAEGNVVASSTEADEENERISETLLAGTYYVRVEVQEEGDNDFRLRYGVDEPDAAKVAVLEATQKAATNEAPAFGQASYAFDLAENADGSTDGVALGAVEATDPEDDALTYSIEGGNEAGLFAIDASTGALSYTGPGEDYESGTTGYELTVRASDGSLHSDVTVTVNVTDVTESASEPVDQDLPASVATAGRIAVGDKVTGEIEDYTDSQGLEIYDSDWFAVELEAGRTYTFDLRGSPTDGDPLKDPYLAGIHDGSGTLVDGTTDNDGGGGWNSRVAFTPTESGTYYVAARGSFYQGAYELEVNDTTGSPAPVPDDYDDGTGTTGVLSLDSDTGVAVVYGDVDSGGDVDWFKLELEADQSVIVRMTGYNPETKSFYGGIKKPQIKGVYDTDGELLPNTSTTDDTGVWQNFGTESRISGFMTGGGGEWKEARLLFKAGEAGTYYVAVGGLESMQSGTDTVLGLLGQSPAETQTQTGKYTLAISPGPSADDFADDTGSTGSVAVGGTVQGKIEWEEDEDWIAVALTGGVRYEFELTGTEGSREYPVFGRHIWDGNGNPYARWSGDDVITERGNTTDHGFFTPLESGTYYIPVEGGSYDGFWDGNRTLSEYWDEALAYTLAVTEAEDQAPADDYSADTTTTGEMEVGGDSVSGEVGTPGDVDWFAVDLVAGKTYVFIQKGSFRSDEYTLPSPRIAGVYDSDGNAIPDTASSDRSNIAGGARVAYTATETGTHYVAAGSESWGQRTGTYTVEAHEIDADSIAADSTTTKTMTVRTVWFKVVLDAGKPYIVKAGETGEDTDVQPFDVHVHDADGTLLDTWWSAGSTSVTAHISASKNVGGTHYVAVTTDTGNDGTAYTVEAHEVDPTTASSSSPTTIGTKYVTQLDEAPAWAGDLPTRETTGVIETVDDVDWIAVDLEAGRTYEFSVGAERFTFGSFPGDSLGDFVLEGLYDAKGRAVVTTDGDSEFSYEAASDGTYYVAVAAGEVYGLGHYRVTVEEQPQTSVSEPDGADLPANATTTGRAAVGGVVTGEIGTSGDRDWFAVDLVAGGNYQIDLRGSHTRDGTLRNPYLQDLRDADGELVGLIGGLNQEDGLNSRLTFTPTESGTYYIVASGARGETGTYELEVTETSTPNRAPAFAEASYAFDLAEVADGSTTGVLLGSVSASDPEDGTVTYTIASGNDAGLFAIDASTGALSYTGSGHETGVTGYGLTVRASDGELHSDVTVSIDLTDTDQAPVFARPDYVFELVENAERVALGTVQAADQEGATVTYSIASGNEAGLFAIDSATGALSYSGPGEDFEADMPSYEFTVRASDGSLHSDVVVTVNVTDVWESAVPDADDFAADTSTTGRVTVGAKTTGEVETTGDIDWFAVTLQAGNTYQIDLLGIEASSYAKAGSATRFGTLGDAEIHGIHDAAGNLIPGTTNGDFAHEDFGGTDNSRVMFTPTESATYYVAAGASPTTHTDTGTYTVIVTDVTDDVTDDYAAGTATTGTVTVGGSVTGNANFAVDRDWFAVTLEGGQTYRFDLEGKDTGAGTLADPALHGIYDADGNLADNTTSDDGGIGENSQVLFTPTVNGTYYVVAGASDDAGYVEDALGTYKLSVTDVTDTLDDDYTAGTNTTGTVAVGGTAAGEVEVARDRDWFAATLEAGKTYRIDVKGADSGSGTLEDPYLKGIHDTDGNLILTTDADDGGTGRDSRVKFRPTEDGTYYIAAGGNDNDEHTGTYQVAVREVSNPNTDDFSAGTDTTGEVEVGGTATGELDLSSDHDWFKVTLEAGRTYRIDLGREDVSAGSGYWYPVLLGIHDADGEMIAKTLDFTATEDGSHFVAVGSGSSKGSYILSVEDITDDFAASTDTTGKVAVGGLVKGNIEVAGDRDWIAVDLEAGTTYQIDLKGSWTDTDVGAIYNPYVHGLYNADGQLIASTVDDDSGPGSDSRVSVAVTQSGTYYVAVGSHPGFEDDASRGEGSYALMVSDLGVENAPMFPETAYAFDLAENRDGSVNRITVGRITAADPEEAVLTYSIVEGNDADRFEIRSGTHDSRSWLYYVGSGEDFESETTSHELTVRASDGTLHTDVTVVVNITDVVEDAL